MFGIQAPESNNGCILSGGRGKGVCGGGVEDGCVWYTGPCKGCFAFCLGEGVGVGGVSSCDEAEVGCDVILPKIRQDERL